MPPSTALLVIDMQNYFLPQTSTALPNILRLISYFQGRGEPVFFTQHGHPREEREGKVGNSLVRKWGPDGCITTGSKDWHLIPAIAAAARANNSPILPKNSYDAFINTDLEARLRANGVEKVVVCGVLTDCCCDTTAKSAFNRGFEVLLVGDACGTFGEEAQRESLQRFGRYYEGVVDTEEVLKRVQ